MRKYICGDCGTVFNEDEAEYRSELVGEFWGAPAYNDILVCPRCRSDEIGECEGESENE